MPHSRGPATRRWKLDEQARDDGGHRTCSVRSRGSRIRNRGACHEARSRAVTTFATRTANTDRNRKLLVPDFGCRPVRSPLFRAFRSPPVARLLEYGTIAFVSLRISFRDYHMTSPRGILAVLIVMVTALPARPGEPALDSHGDPLPPHALARLGSLRFRHDEMITRIAVAPDKKTVVAVG